MTSPRCDNGLENWQITEPGQWSNKARSDSDDRLRGAHKDVDRLKGFAWGAHPLERVDDSVMNDNSDARSGKPALKCAAMCTDVSTRVQAERLCSVCRRCRARDGNLWGHCTCAVETGRAS